jgi:hypothetical protein
VHLLDHEGGAIMLDGYNPKIQSAVYFDDGSRVEVKKSVEGLVLDVPEGKIKPIDTIIVLTLK